MLSTNWLLKPLGTFVEQYSYSISLWIKYCVNPVGLLPFRLSFPNSLFPLLSFHCPPFLRSPAFFNSWPFLVCWTPAAFLGKYSPPVFCLTAPVFFVFSYHRQTLDVTSFPLVHSVWCGGLTKTEAFCSNDLFSFVCWFLINNDSSVTLNQAAICSEKQCFACNVDPQCGADSVCGSVCASVYLTPHLFQWPSDVVLALTYCSRKNRGQDVCII